MKKQRVKKIFNDIAELEAAINEVSIKKIKYESFGNVTVVCKKNGVTLLIQIPKWEKWTDYDWRGINLTYKDIAKYAYENNIQSKIVAIWNMKINKRILASDVFRDVKELGESIIEIKIHHEGDCPVADIMCERKGIRLLVSLNMISDDFLQSYTYDEFPELAFDLFADVQFLSINWDHN